MNEMCSCGSADIGYFSNILNQIRKANADIGSYFKVMVSVCCSSEKVAVGVGVFSLFGKLKPSPSFDGPAASNAPVAATVAQKKSKHKKCPALPTSWNSQSI